MNKIKYYFEKYKIYIILIIIILFLVLSIILLLFNYSNYNTNEEIKEEKIEIKEEKTPEIEEKYKVDIKGLVLNPGVYELDDNSRVIDVINASGGLIDGANTEYINLSKKITDEMVIIIYSNSELEKYKEGKKDTVYIEYECVCPDNINNACIDKNDTVNTNGSTINKETKISINEGTLEELMTLNGIGESKAKAIIEYRETNGNFLLLEDIMNVSGIGDSAYEKIKDYIKL